MRGEVRSEYCPPAFEESKFHCPSCGVFAHQVWRNVGTPLQVGWHDLPALKISTCTYCGNMTVWHNGTLVVPPVSPAAPAHPDLPDDCRADYDEARAVFSQSPRAAAALLRLCIQKLMPHLGEAGDNINADIASLVAKGLSPRVQQALDFCRVVGNNAVHPGEIQINDTPEIAQSLFGMINFIVEDRITRPREIDELYNQLPQGARDAINRRDGQVP